MKLKEVLKYIDYNARLQILQKHNRKYEYVFSKDDYITREHIENNYPNLLELELKEGIHSQGQYEGIYIVL